MQQESFSAAFFCLLTATKKETPEKASLFSSLVPNKGDY